MLKDNSFIEIFSWVFSIHGVFFGVRICRSLNYDTLDCFSCFFVLKCMKPKKLVLALLKVYCLYVTVNSHVRQVILSTLATIDFINIIEGNFWLDSVSFLEPSDEKFPKLNWLKDFTSFINALIFFWRFGLRFLRVCEVLDLFNDSVNFSDWLYCLIRGQWDLCLFLLVGRWNLIWADGLEIDMENFLFGLTSGIQFR